MRRLLTFALVWVALLTGVILAARAVGTSIFVEPLYLDTGGCRQPCWHGIKPGATKLADAFQILQADRLIYDLIRNDPNPIYHCELEWKMQTIPYFTGCISVQPDGPATFIELHFADDQVYLADLFALFGRPINASLCQRYDFGPRYRRATFAVVYFRDNVSIIAYDLRPDAWQLTPAMFVKVVRYDMPANEPAIRFDTPRWRGFGTSRIYGYTC